MTPDLRETIALLREQGVTGPVEINGVKFVIPHDPVVGGDSSEAKAQARKDRQKEYDSMLFAATEGIHDEDDEVKG